MGRKADERSRPPIRHTSLVALVVCSLAPILVGVATAEPLSATDSLYSPSAPLVDENPYVTAEYSGTLKQESTITGGIEHDQLKAEVKWNTKVSGPVDQIEYAAAYGPSAIHWQVTELTGTVSDKGENVGPKTTFGCNGNFTKTSSDGGTRGIELPLDEPGYPAGGGNPATNADYRAAPPQGIPLVLLSSDSSSSDTRCSTSMWTTPGQWLGSATSQPGWESATGPVLYFPPGAPFTQTISPPEYTCACGPEHTFKVSLTSTLKFTSPPLPGRAGPTTGPTTGHAPTSKPPGPPISCGSGSKPSCMDKKVAQEDLLHELKPVTFNCELAALGIAGVVAALAAPETGAAAFLAAEGVVGAEVSALAGTTCGLLLGRVYDDAKIVEDPAEGGLSKLARPAFPKGPVVHRPPCGPFNKALQLCRRLRAQTLAYANSLAKGKALTAALLTTVDRMTGAELGHKRSALSKQARHATSLRKQLATQYTAQRHAGRAIARLLTRAHFGAAISAAQAQAGQAGALSKLARRGVAAGALETAAASELPAGSIAAEAGFAG